MVPNSAVIVDNSDWLDGLGYIDFLRRCRKTVYRK